MGTYRVLRLVIKSDFLIMKFDPFCICGCVSMYQRADFLNVSTETQIWMLEPYKKNVIEVFVRIKLSNKI